ncbi:MAG: S8 family serine peptidase [Candidatus Aenigmarchaeota archaeon]|nr:S8 family serine peptidase [Candidatus Aenigmarchaeota archaeon]
MKKLVFLISFFLLSIFLSNIIIASNHIIGEENYTYDVQLASILTEAGIKYSQQDLIDYSNATEIPLIVEYDSPVTQGKEEGKVSPEGKTQVRDLTSNSDNLNTINSIRSITSLNGGKFKTSYKTISYTALSISRTKLKNFKSDLKSNLGDKLKNVYVDSKVQVYLKWSVPDIADPVKRETVESEYGPLNGSGVTIAIIDTGIDKTHPDLDDLDDDPYTNDPKVIEEKCFCSPAEWRNACCPNGQSENDNARDDHGHGTHVASIAAGNGNASIQASKDLPPGLYQYIYIGVAPQANLIGVKVLDRSGYGLESDIISGIEWAQDRADILSLSLGSPINGDGTDPLSEAVNRATDNGVIVVVAAGNFGPSLGTLGEPGVAEKAITVGASYSSRLEGWEEKNWGDCIDMDITEGEPVCFSSRGMTADLRIKPDVIAPGTRTCAALSSIGIPGSWTCGDMNAYYYTEMSGTSMATPMVAGAAALILQAHPNWTPEMVKSALMTTAKDQDVSPLTQGSGRINVFDAVDSSIYVFPQSISFGVIREGNPIISEFLHIENINQEILTVNIDTSEVVDDYGNSYSISYVNRSSFTISPGDIENVILSVEISETLPRISHYYGYVNIHVNGKLYRIPYLFYIPPEPFLVRPVLPTDPSIDIVQDGKIEESEWADASVYTNLGTNNNFDLYIKSPPTSCILMIGLRIRNANLSDNSQICLFFDEGDDGFHGSGSRDYASKLGQEDAKCFEIYSDGSSLLFDGHFNIGFSGVGWYGVRTGYPADNIQEYTDVNGEKYLEAEYLILIVGLDGRRLDQSDLTVKNPADKIGFAIRYSWYPDSNPEDKIIYTSPANLDEYYAPSFNEIFINNHECIGDVTLGLWPPGEVEPRNIVEAIAQGLSGCINQIIYIRKDSCDGVGACEIFELEDWYAYPPCLWGLTCSNCMCKFKAPNLGGNHTYYACIDKNWDGDFDDPGESGSRVLSVNCRGDIDGDFDVDYDDWIVVAGAYGSSIGQPAYDARADFDKDGDVDYDDFMVLAGYYETTCSGYKGQFKGPKKITEGMMKKIEGYKGESPYFTLPYLLGITIPFVSFVIIALIEILVLSLIIRKLQKGYLKERKR